MNFSLVQIFLVIAGAIFAITGLIRSYKFFRVYRKGQKGLAKITAVKHQTHRDNSGMKNTRYYCTLELIDSSGEKHILPPSDYLAQPAQPGEEIEIYYNPINPRQYIIKKNLYWGPFQAALGFLFLAIAFFLSA